MNIWNQRQSFAVGDDGKEKAGGARGTLERMSMKLMVCGNRKSEECIVPTMSLLRFARPFCWNMVFPGGKRSICEAGFSR